MPKAAEIELEILADGTVKWKTGRIPDEHHNAADELQAELEALLGGPVERERTSAKPVHTHHKDHVHEHEHGDGHSHDHSH